MSVCQAKTSKEKHSQEKSCNIMQSKYLVLDISNVQTYKISVFSLLRLYGTLCVLVSCEATLDTAHVCSRQLAISPSKIA